jgi:cell division protein FtsN
MAAKRSKNQAKRNGGSGGIPGWMWLLVGLLIGALAFGYLFLKDKWAAGNSGLPTPNPEAQAPASSGNDPVVPEPVEKPKPKYEFYTLLPEKEVLIPDAELAAQARAEAVKPVTAKPATTIPSTTAATTASADAPAPPSTSAIAIADGERYLLQAGAFRGNDDAEALKAKIALTGEVARVEAAQINGNTVYRVRMGPYPNASSLAAAKQALVSHGIAGAQAIRAK